MNRVFLILSIMAFAMSPARSETALRLLHACDAAPACLRMTLDVDGAHRPVRDGDADGLISRVVHLDDDWTDYELNVEGRLGGGTPQSHRILFRAYTGGLACTHFGQGSVAVTGFSPDAKPLVLTSAGELEITNAPRLSLGCPDCLQLLDRRTKRPVTSYPTPAWDLRLVGYRQGAFRYNAKGEVFLRKGGRCIRLATVGRFRAVGMEHCETPLREVGHFGLPGQGITLDPGEWLFESRKTDLLMRLVAGACT